MVWWLASLFTVYLGGVLKMGRLECPHWNLRVAPFNWSLVVNHGVFCVCLDCHKTVFNDFVYGVVECAG